MRAINYYRCKDGSQIPLCPECARFFDAEYVADGEKDLFCDECGASQKEQIGLCEICASYLGLGDQIVEGPSDIACEECGGRTRLVYVYAEHYPPRTIVISVKGGVVVEVGPLPPGWSYAVFDEDGAS